VLLPIPQKKVALTVHRHWKNIKTYFENPITNAASESMNSKIQRVKVMARGFRNRARYRSAILGTKCAAAYPGPAASLAQPCSVVPRSSAVLHPDGTDVGRRQG
jgi:hypothetical protein